MLIYRTKGGQPPRPDDVPVPPARTDPHLDGVMCAAAVPGESGSTQGLVRTLFSITRRIRAAAPQAPVASAGLGLGLRTRAPTLGPNIGHHLSDNIGGN